MSDIQSHLQAKPIANRHEAATCFRPCNGTFADHAIPTILSRAFDASHRLPAARPNPPYTRYESNLIEDVIETKGNAINSLKKSAIGHDTDSEMIMKSLLNRYETIRFVRIGG